MATVDTDALIATRRAIQVVAEHVLLPDLYDHTGHIGLRPLGGGFGTPAYRQRGGGLRRLRVEATDVVDERDHRVVARVPLTTPRTLRELRATLGVTAMAPADVYDLGSTGVLDRTLVVDPASAAVLSSLFSVTREALTIFAEETRPAAGSPPDPDDDVGAIRLWPEHLELSRSIDEVVYGASPGDDDHPEPYLFATPWEQIGPDWPDLQTPGYRLSALPVPPLVTVLEWFHRMRSSPPP